MFRRLALLAFTLLLGACASNQVNHDFDTSRDFAAYRSWSWKEPALQYRPDDPRIKSDLTEQRIRQAVADQLDQRGLRPAAGGHGDVLVQAYLIVEDRQQQITTNYGGGGWGGPWNGYWGGPMYNETATSATRSPPCRSTCSMARTASWCGVAVTNNCSATPPTRLTATRPCARRWDGSCPTTRRVDHDVSKMDVS